MKRTLAILATAALLAGMVATDAMDAADSEVVTWVAT
jgi:hypothetical protein